MKFLANLCNSTTLLLCFREKIVKFKFQIFQMQEVIVTQWLVVEYVCMSETQ